MKLINFSRLLIFSLAAISLIGCSELDDLISVGTGRGVPVDTLDVGMGGGKWQYSDNPEGQLVYIKIDNGFLRGRLYIPEGEGPFPGVVVMHGCTGLWENAVEGDMKAPYDTWAEIFHSQEKYVALFVDSYVARNIDEFCGIEPPADFNCSPVFVRNRDAYAGLEFLRDIDQVIDNKIGILGFSHGGTATLNAVVDYDYVKKANETLWKQYKNGWYDYDDGVRAPMAAPQEGGFAVAVAYYPGAAMYSYYGSISNPNSGKYLNYAPVLINAAELDPLYDNNPNDSTDGKTMVFCKRAWLHGASANTGNELLLEVYEDANHTFDGKQNGADGDANIDAKINTLNFLEKYLK